VADLVQLEAYIAKGGYRTQSGFIKGLGNYTGATITMLVNTFQPASAIVQSQSLFRGRGKFIL